MKKNRQVDNVGISSENSGLTAVKQFLKEELDKPYSLYVVRRARKDDTLYGPSHGSDYGSKTLCGISLEDHYWYITHNAFDGKITCKKCLKEAVKPFPRQES